MTLKLNLLVFKMYKIDIKHYSLHTYVHIGCKIFYMIARNNIILNTVI